jgi:hypothetical protein
MASPLAGSAASEWSATASPPAATICAATWSAGPRPSASTTRLRLLTTTFAPCRASARQNDRPSPRPPPSEHIDTRDTLSRPGRDQPEVLAADPRRRVRHRVDAGCAEPVEGDAGDVSPAGQRGGGAGNAGALFGVLRSTPDDHVLDPAGIEAKSE